MGSIWIDLHDTGEIKAPALSIMLGDPTFRAQGIGSTAIQAVISYLQHQGHDRIYARHTIDNTASAKTLSALGFNPDEPAYRSPHDHFTWQNRILFMTI